MLEIRQTLDDRCLGPYNEMSAHGTSSSYTIRQPTKSMAVMFDCNAKDLKRMHADRHALHPLFALENEINRAGEQVYEGITVRCG